MRKRTGLIFGSLSLIYLCWAVAYPVRVQAQAAISEVTILHTGCFGTCPVYELTLRRDGTATYVGSNHVAKVGTYTASIGAARFDHLARAITLHGFNRFKPNYTISITDQSHVITTVVQGGHRKTVDNYADTGPQPLWEIQFIIDGVVAEAQWKKVSNSTDFH